MARVLEFVLVDDGDASVGIGATLEFVSVVFYGDNNERPDPLIVEDLRRCLSDISGAACVTRQEWYQMTARDAEVTG